MKLNHNTVVIALIVLTIAFAKACYVVFTTLKPIVIEFVKAQAGDTEIIETVIELDDQAKEIATSALVATQSVILLTIDASSAFIALTTKLSQSASFHAILDTVEAYKGMVTEAATMVYTAKVSIG